MAKEVGWQTMKALIRSIAAAVVFAILLFYVFAFERGRVPEKDEIFGLNVEQTSRLQVTGPGMDLLIEKHDDTWYVKKPFKGLADQDEAETRIKAITELKPSGTRSDLDLDDEKFGLKEPRLTAVLNYGKGKKIKLLVGKKTPVGSEIYARIEGRKDLYILPATVFSTLNLTADKLREKTVAKIESDKVLSLSLTHGDTTIKVENRAEGDKDKWFITSPISARADEFQTEQVVTKLAGLEAKDFVDEPAKDADYGFDKPSLLAEVLDEEGNKAAITIGAKSDKRDESSLDGGELFYAKVEGRDEILLVAAEDVAELRKQPIDLRDTFIVELDKQNINYVRVQSTKRLSFAIKRLPDGWHLDRPIKAVTKAGKVDDILYDIVQLEAREYIADKPEDLKQYGLAIPSDIIEVHSIDTDDVLKIKIGYAYGADAHYCQTSESDQVYVVSDMLLLDLPKKLEDIQASS